MGRADRQVPKMYLGSGTKMMQPHTHTYSERQILKSRKIPTLPPMSPRSGVTFHYLRDVGYLDPTYMALTFKKSYFLRKQTKSIGSAD